MKRTEKNKKPKHCYPARNMCPKVYIEMVDGIYTKAFADVIIYNAIMIRGITIVTSKRTKKLKVFMPRLPAYMHGEHTSSVYPLNGWVREVLYAEIIKEYLRQAEISEESRRKFNPASDDGESASNKAMETSNERKENCNPRWKNSNPTGDSGQHGAD